MYHNLCAGNFLCAPKKEPLVSLAARTTRPHKNPVSNYVTGGRLTFCGFCKVWAVHPQIEGTLPLAIFMGFVKVISSHRLSCPQIPNYSTLPTTKAPEVLRDLVVSFPKETLQHEQTIGDSGNRGREIGDEIGDRRNVYQNLLLPKRKGNFPSVPYFPGHPPVALLLILLQATWNSCG